MSAGDVSLSDVRIGKTKEPKKMQLSVCRIYGHERWRGSGRCKWCGAHRDGERASG